jgi:type I restriction enzyme S subunit
LLFCSSLGKHQIFSFENGTSREGLNFQQAGDLIFAIPPLEEQRSLAQFLDYKTAQIDALIAKKEELLERLAEKRTALISEAVRKGIDRTVPMKDSGIEWLGAIPAHWEVVRLRFLLKKIEQGWSPQCHNQAAEPGEWGVLKVGCVNGEEFDENKNKALPENLEPKLEYELHHGDILMSRANTKELLGSAAVVENPRSKLLLCDKLYRLLVGSDINKNYLTFLLRSSIARFQYERAATGTSGSMQNIGQDTIKDLIFPLPPKFDRDLIFEYLKSSFLKLDKIQEATQKAIDTLKEYRTALITNAVTGKIDVRQVEIPDSYTQG